MSVVGQERPIRNIRDESGYPPIATESLHCSKCSIGPYATCQALSTTPAVTVKLPNARTVNI